MFRLVIQAILGKLKVRQEIQILVIRFVILKVRNLLHRYNLKGTPLRYSALTWIVEFMSLSYQPGSQQSFHTTYFSSSRFCTNFVGKCHSGAVLTGARSSPTPNCTEGTWLTRNKQQQDLNQFFPQTNTQISNEFFRSQKTSRTYFSYSLFFSPYISGLPGIDYFIFIFSQVIVSCMCNIIAWC